MMLTHRIKFDVFDENDLARVGIENRSINDVLDTLTISLSEKFKGSGSSDRRINLWDLGMNPVGVLDADTASTLEFAPVTGSASSVASFVPGPGERQTLGARDFRTYYEAWRRTGNSTYGAVGDWMY